MVAVHLGPNRSVGPPWGKRKSVWTLGRGDLTLSEGDGARRQHLGLDFEGEVMLKKLVWHLVESRSLSVRLNWVGI